MVSERFKIKFQLGGIAIEGNRPFETPLRLKSLSFVPGCHDSAVSARVRQSFVRLVVYALPLAVKLPWFSVKFKSRRSNMSDSYSM